MLPQIAGKAWPHSPTAGWQSLAPLHRPGIDHKGRRSSPGPFLQARSLGQLLGHLPLVALDLALAFLEGSGVRLNRRAPPVDPLVELPGGLGDGVKKLVCSCAVLALIVSSQWRTMSRCKSLSQSSMSSFAAPLPAEEAAGVSGIVEGEAPSSARSGSFDAALFGRVCRSGVMQLRAGIAQSQPPTSST